jgi:hypothetical protein
MAKILYMVVEHFKNQDPAVLTSQEAADKVNPLL